MNNKYLWIDLETTGLDKDKCSVIELAAVITDKSLEERASIHHIAYTPEAHWETEALVMHANTGLINKIGNRDLAISQKSLEESLYFFIRDNFDRSAILAGSSVHSDKKFIDLKWPAISCLLSHRILDTSSLSYFARDSFGDDIFDNWKLENGYDKASHSAKDDIYYSLNLARFIKSKINWKI